MPVAAIAPWCSARNTVGLVGKTAERGRTLPVDTDELPALTECDRGYVSEQIAVFLTPLIEKWRIPATRIAKVSGLLTGGDAGNSLIYGGEVSNSTRILKILAFRLDIEGVPQFLGSWHPPSEAFKQINARDSRIERSVGTIILNRSLSGRPMGQ